MLVIGSTPMWTKHFIMVLCVLVCVSPGLCVHVSTLTQRVCKQKEIRGRFTECLHEAVIKLLA